MSKKKTQLENTTKLLNTFQKGEEALIMMRNQGMEIRELQWEPCDYKNTVCIKCDYKTMENLEPCHQNCSEIDFLGTGGHKAMANCSVMVRKGLQLERHCKKCGHHHRYHHHVKCLPRVVVKVSYIFSTEQKLQLEKCTSGKEKLEKMKAQLQENMTDLSKK